MLYPDGHIFAQQSQDDEYEKLGRVSEDFHTGSKITRVDRAASQRAKKDPVQRAYARNADRMQQAFYDLIEVGGKRYPQAPRIALPTAPQMLQRDLGEVIRARQTHRQYRDQAMTLDQIATLLFLGYGIMRYEAADPPRYPRRAVPSGGGVYPLEMYLLALRIDGLNPGIYHYDVYAHALEQLSVGKMREKLAKTLLYDELAQRAAATIVLSGVFERPRFKYGELGYRLVLLEAGHIGQNLCLLAEGCSLGVCPVVGFVEDDVNAILGLDGVDESTLYLFVIGQPQVAIPSAIAPELAT